MGAKTLGVSSAELLNALELTCQQGGATLTGKTPRGDQGCRTVEPVVRRADNSVCAFAASASG